MSKWERWTHITMLMICLIDISIGSTTWGTFCCCGIWVNAWMYDRIVGFNYEQWQRNKIERLIHGDPNYVIHVATYRSITANVGDRA